MSSGWYNSKYPRDVDVLNVAVPTDLTELWSGDGEIYLINVSNTTGAPITFLVQDEQASPLALIPTISVPANTVDLVVYDSTGLLCKGGVKWQAGGAGLVASVRGRRTTGWTQTNGYVPDVSTQNV